MCTSLTYQMENNANALARTFDFMYILKPSATFIPRQYQWNSQGDGTQHTSRYAFTGLAEKTEGFIFADGINEKGLGCAVLYFSGFAVYNEQPQQGKTSLAPYEVVFWMLSAFTDLNEVRAGVRDLHIVGKGLANLGVVPPLHWIVTDRSGKSIVIEPMEDGLHVMDNPVNVLTNSPDFPWHMTNIRNYIHVNPHQLNPIEIGGVTFAPFSQGSGTFGLPGDYTPPSRFIRVLFGRETIGKASNEMDAVTAVFHLLYTVDIPKGSVVSADNETDFTQYSSCMFCDSCTYYFKTYDNNQISKIDLLKEDLDAVEPKMWPINQEQQIWMVN